MSIVLAVLSDIHATDGRFRPVVPRKFRKKPPGKGTWLDYADAGPNPLIELRSIIDRHRVRADYLVMPGDLCHQANGDAMAAAWSDLDSIAESLGSRATIATVGNHDVDSRYRSNAYDPLRSLHSLTPRFPVLDQAQRNEFWANGVTSLEFADSWFVIVDSCRFHPHRESEIDHGRISDEMLADIRERLQGVSAKPHNILVCHHHPHPFPMGREEANDDRMLNGENMLRLLGLDDRSWLVIHGHRHLARLTYASGGATAPVVLSAGSVAAVIPPEYAPGVRNQVHFVTLLDAPPQGMVIAGEVESWEYTPHAGWEPASSVMRQDSLRFTDISALPHRTGFGYRGSLTSLAQNIANAVAHGTGPTSWSEIASQVPAVRYLIPENFQALARLLSDRHRLRLVPPGFSPSEITGASDA